MAKQNDEAILKELRERYSYAIEGWEPVRKEARIDMRFLNGDPWPAEEKQVRIDANRTEFALDELNQ